MRRPAAAALVVSALALAVPGAASAGSVHLEQFVSTGGTVQVSVVVRKAASFSVLLRTRTVGRTQLFVIGKHAPKGGPLMDTATTACDGAAGLVLLQGLVRAAAAGDVHVPRRCARPASARTSSSP